MTLKGELTFLAHTKPGDTILIESEEAGKHLRLCDVVNNVTTKGVVTVTLRVVGHHDFDLFEVVIGRGGMKTCLIVGQVSEGPVETSSAIPTVEESMAEIFPNLANQKIEMRNGADPDPQFGGIGAEHVPAIEDEVQQMATPELTIDEIVRESTAKIVAGIQRYMDSLVATPIDLPISVAAHYQMPTATLATHDFNEVRPGVCYCGRHKTDSIHGSATRPHKFSALHGQPCTVCDCAENHPMHTATRIRRQDGEHIHQPDARNETCVVCGKVKENW